MLLEKWAGGGTRVSRTICKLVPTESHDQTGQSSPLVLVNRPVGWKGCLAVVGAGRYSKNSWGARYSGKGTERYLIMFRNGARTPDRFDLPPERTIEIARQIAI